MFAKREGRTGVRVKSRVGSRPCVVGEPEHVEKQHAREPGDLCNLSMTNRERSEKALSRTAGVYVAEESDQAILPTNRPNKEGQPLAEVGEGRAWREENVVRSGTSPTLSGTTCVTRANRRTKGLVPSYLIRARSRMR